MHDDDTEDTVIRPRSRPLRSVPDDAPTSGDDATSDDDALCDDTVVRPAPAPRSDPLGDTVIRPGQSASPPPALHRDSTPPVRARVPSIRVGDSRHRLDRPVVIGRRPALPRIVTGPEPLLVTVPSPLGQVSSSHLLVHAEGDVAVIQDLRSTNGTVIRPAGAPPYRMAAGASIVALTGTVVEIGDGIAIEVLSPHLRATPPGDDLPPPSRSPRRS